MEAKIENLVLKMITENETEATENLKIETAGNDRLVCTCNHVNVGTLLAALDNKIFNFDKLCLATNAGTDCGDCKGDYGGKVEI
jgi:NAD(P)H-nitrite reductase large subunit